MSLPIFTNGRLQAAQSMHPFLRIETIDPISRQPRKTFPTRRFSQASLSPPAAAEAQSAPTAAATVVDDKAPTSPADKARTNLKGSGQKKNRPPRAGPAERESLELLAWPELCRQVASLCRTAMGAQRAISGRLPLGSTLEESEFLLRQTKEAAALQLNFEGIYYLKRAQEAAAAQHVLHPLVLGAVATTLSAAQRIGETVEAGGEKTKALQHLARGIKDFLPQLLPLVENIKSCIQVKEGRVLDTASELLASTRAARQENIATLRRTSDEWARDLYESGAAERPQVVVRRDRLCIPVRAGRQSDLPRGSVALATSSSGSTIYMEPAPLVPLNNAEAALGAAEREEEDRILGELSGNVAAAEKPMRAVLVAVTALDIAAARAKHATWLGAVEPILKNTTNGTENGTNLNYTGTENGTIDSQDLRDTVSDLSCGLVRVLGAVHPLLIEPLLPPLPKPPLPEAAPLSIGADAGLGSLSGVNLVPELWKAIEKETGPVSSVPQRRPRRRPSKGGNAASDIENEVLGADSSPTSTGYVEDVNGLDVPGSDFGSSSRRSLIPIDFVVPLGKSVVAVTGPNTGGKTASLKTLGLLALMAKAGMFIPAGQGDGESSHAQQQGASRPIIPWFDKVLADVGDGQSLQQSLSTFSGHVRRLKGVLQESTPSSLVLLDEVGSGTDPGEGAALAAALLLRLSSGKAALTYATTHHSELKEVAATHPAFVNASVEFNLSSLHPTYRHLWGSSGESNALAVAQGLGFDPRVVQDAREVAAQLTEGETSAADRAAALHQSLKEQAAAARIAAEESVRRKIKAETAMKEAEEQLKLQKAEHAAAFAKNSKNNKGSSSDGGRGKGVESAISSVESTQMKIRKVLAQVRNGEMTPEEGDKELKRIERALGNADNAAMTLAGLRWGDTSIDEDERQQQQEQFSEGWIPQPGQYVKVLKMGGAVGQVGGITAGGAKISVRIGALTMQLPLSDLAPASGPPQSSSSTGKFSSSNPRGKLKANGALKNGAESQPGGNGGSPLGVAVQTNSNTVDLRGLTPDDAVAETEVALNDARPGSVVFIVHGVGTGRVRAAVLDALKRHPTVMKMEEAEASNGGCTVAYLR